MINHGVTDEKAVAATSADHMATHSAFDLRIESVEEAIVLASVLQIALDARLASLPDTAGVSRYAFNTLTRLRDATLAHIHPNSCRDWSWLPSTRAELAQALTPLLAG